MTDMVRRVFDAVAMGDLGNTKSFDPDRSRISAHQELESEFDFSRFPPEIVEAFAELVESRRLSGRYQICQKLGEGSFGLVYLAHDGLLDRHVAIKVANQPASTDPTDDLLTEARMAARLDHPGIVRVYDVVTLKFGTSTS